MVAVHSRRARSSGFIWKPGLVVTADKTSAEGASNRLVAHCLSISVHIAKFHVGSLFDKLDATGRTNAVAHSARLGVIRL